MSVAPLAGQEPLFRDFVGAEPEAQTPTVDPTLCSGGATFGADGDYRYELTRCWDHESPRRVLLWVCLNPSDAGALRGDPSTTRMVRFSQRWGFTEMKLVNVFGRITSKPAELLEMERDGVDIIGPCNDRHIHRAAWSAQQIVVAWGASVRRHPARVAHVLGLLSQAPCVAWARTPLSCLGTTIDGYPRHPLYLKKELDLEPFEVGHGS